MDLESTQGSPEPLPNGQPTHGLPGAPTGPPGPGRQGHLLAGRYRIDAQLGRGGMGVVSRARDLQANRDVALKVLLAEELSPSQEERFRREGELAAAIRHPGVVQVHAAGVAEDGRPYLVSELVEGARTMRDVFPQLDLEDRIELVRQTAEALGAAHEAGIVHRDVKPENVLVDAAGRARVTDFGAALSADLERLTRTGGLVGTPYFMAPEQLDGGRSVGPPADVWALGVMLYEAATGSKPFLASSLIELSGKVSQGRYTPPSTIEPDLPPGLIEVIERCLRVDASKRFADGAELAAALDGALERTPSLGHRFRSLPPLVRWLLVLVLVLTLALVWTAAGYLLYLRPRQVARKTLDEGLRWRAEVLDPWAWGLSLEPGAAPARDEVAQRRDGVEAALQRLGEEASPEARALGQELLAVERLLTPRGEDAAAGAEVTPPLLVAQAARLRETGLPAEALRRVEAGRLLQPGFLPGLLLELRLLAEVDPERFRRRCAKDPPSPPRAQALARSLLAAQVEEVVQELASADVAAGERTLRALREASTGLEVAPERFAAAVAQGLEASAPAWEAQVHGAAPAALLEHLRRLEAFLAEAPPAAPGARLRAALEGAFKRALNGALRPGASTAAGLRVIDLDEVLTYGLGLAGRGQPDYSRLLRSIRPAILHDAPDAWPRFTIALLRAGMPVWAKNAVNGVPVAPLQAFLAAHPDSQAARFAVWLTRHKNPWRSQGGLEGLEEVERAPLRDLAVIYQGEVDAYRVRRLLTKAWKDRAQWEPLFALSRRARTRLEAGDEQLRRGLGHYQRGGWLLDMARFELEGLKALGRLDEAVRLSRGMIHTMAARLKRLPPNARNHDLAVARVAEAKLSTAQVLLDAKTPAPARALIQDARATLRRLDKPGLLKLADELEAKLPR